MSSSQPLPQLTLDDYETRFAGRHTLPDLVRHWAAERPTAPALLSADSGRPVSWKQFDRYTTALAGTFAKQLGIRKGDFVATILPMTAEHVQLEFACFRLGAVVVPLDLQTPQAELLRILETLRPKALFALGIKGETDLRPLWNELAERCPWLEARVVLDSMRAVEKTTNYHAYYYYAWRAAMTCTTLDSADAALEENDPALAIFTTGSTGSPKPALLSHRGITAQGMCLSQAFFGGDQGVRTLVNLPGSHVGGQTELLMGTLFGGGTAVLIDAFDAAESLAAVAKHKVEILGQIPTLFELEWRLKNYAQYDLSSLRFAAYGGCGVSAEFLGKLRAMAPSAGTGLGLTEASGFCTYLRAGEGDDGLLSGSLGQAMPINPCSIREPMLTDGRAGAELPAGSTGEVCFRGPQNFLGYWGDEEATRRTLSTDGYLYTGDLGRLQEGQLFLAGRSKQVIKSMGHQIFPGDVERHVCALGEQVAGCVAVGAPHAAASEAVVALVERRPGAALELSELERHARELAPYMRPRHWVLLDPGQSPRNRIGKPDYTQARAIALREVELLRARGGWDSNFL